jgi:hypothetical protein
MSSIAHRRSLATLVVAAVLVAIGVWWSSDPGVPVSPSIDHMAPAPPATEEWGGTGAEQGSGTIRVAAGPSSREVEGDMRHQGPLSPGGRDQVTRIVDLAMRDLLETLEARARQRLEDTQPEEPDSQAELSAFLDDRKLLLRFEEYKLIQEMMAEDCYLTLGCEATLPRTEANWSDHVFALPAENGKGVNVVFRVDRGKRDATRAHYDQIAVVAGESAKERALRVTEWNSRPFAERARWIDDHVALGAKAADGMLQLDRSEFRQFMTQTQWLRLLRVRIDRLSASLIPLP